MTRRGRRPFGIWAGAVCTALSAGPAAAGYDLTRTDAYREVAAARARAPTECDRLAGVRGISPHGVPPVRLEDIESYRARTACKRAMREHSGEPRFRALYARALRAEARGSEDLGPLFENRARREIKALLKSGYAPVGVLDYSIESLFVGDLPAWFESVEAVRVGMRSPVPEIAARASAVAFIYGGSGKLKTLEGKQEEALRRLRRLAADGEPEARLALVFLAGLGRNDKVDVSEARQMEYLREAAEDFSGLARLNLGFSYANQDGERAARLAQRWLEKAAALGSPLGEWMLAEHLRERGVATRAETAPLVERAARDGEKNAAFDLALLYRDGAGVGPSIPRMVEWLQKAAQAGSNNAELLLGLHYELGEWVQRDWDRARELYASAYPGGRLKEIKQDAQARLERAGDPPPVLSAARKDALMRALGLSALVRCDVLASFPYDPNRVHRPVYIETLNAEHALDPCRTAMENHPRLARVRLMVARVMLRSEVHAEAGRRHMEALAEQGYAPAVFALVDAAIDDRLDMGSEALERWASRLDGRHPSSAAISAVLELAADRSSSPRENALARKQLRSLADAGNAYALRSMAGAYGSGAWGFEESPRLAAQAVERLARRGDPRAQTALAWRYANGEGLERSTGTACLWYARAAWGGHRSAGAGAARCYWEGEGVHKDPQQAVRWARVGVEHGDPKAMEVLGTFYEQGGEGVPPDLQRAWDLYTDAAVLGRESAKKRREALRESARREGDLRIYFRSVGGIWYD